MYVGFVRFHGVSWKMAEACIFGNDSHNYCLFVWTATLFPNLSISSLLRTVCPCLFFYTCPNVICTVKRPWTAETKQCYSLLVRGRHTPIENTRKCYNYDSFNMAPTRLCEGYLSSNSSLAPVLSWHVYQMVPTSEVVAHVWKKNWSFFLNKLQIRDCSRSNQMLCTDQINDFTLHMHIYFYVTI